MCACVCVCGVFVGFSMVKYFYAVVNCSTNLLPHLDSPTPRGSCKILHESILPLLGIDMFSQWGFREYFRNHYIHKLEVEISPLPFSFINLGTVNFRWVGTQTSYLFTFICPEGSVASGASRTYLSVMTRVRGSLG